MLPAPKPEEHGRRGFLDRVIERYGEWLDWVLDRQRPALWVMVGTLVLTAVLYLAVPKGFFPSQDTGALQAVTEAPESVSFTAMSERQQALASLVLDDPDVESLSSFIGVDGANSTLNSGRMLINLKTHGERDSTALEVMTRLRERAREVPGIRLYLQPVQELTIEDRVSRTQYQFSLTCPDDELLGEWVPRLVERLRTLPELADVVSDLQVNGLQAYLDIDRDSASRHGVSMAEIDDTLYSAFGQRQVSTLFTQSSQYRVVIEMDPRLVTGPQALEGIHVNGRGGRPVPLASVARVIERKTTLLINHIGQFPASTVSFNLADGASLGDAVSAIETAGRDHRPWFQGHVHRQRRGRPRRGGVALHRHAWTGSQRFLFRLDRQGACPPPLVRQSRPIHPSARRVARMLRGRE
jgi:multidrug efflux pump